MADNVQYNEEVAWARLRQKVRQRKEQPHLRLALIPMIAIIIGVLAIVAGGIGLYVQNYATRPLTLPETVQIQPLCVADQLPLQAEEFVQGLKGTGIQVAFDQNYDPQKLGQQEFSLVFRRGNEVCTQTAQLYRFHLENSVTVKLGEEAQVDVRNFVPDETVEAQLLTELTEGKAGMFDIVLQCDGREYTASCTVTEEISPKGTPVEVTVEAGTVPEASAFVKDITDHTAVTVTYQQEPEFILAGEHTVKVLLTDLFGNTTELEASAQVVPAANGPQFAGLTTIYLEVGASVSYKNGVSVTDAQDGELTYDVDPGNFNSKNPGRYTVLYSAQDSDGNKLIMPRTIVVESHVGQLVREKAQEILNQIIKPGMTRDEKIYAVFLRVKNYVWYSGNSDKSSVENGAYEGFTKWAGDCYTYYAMVRVMLDLLEIPNVEVARVGGTSNHWWNLVQFEDGKYYHVDATPHRITQMVHFKMTETVIDNYTKTPAVASYRPNYYVYDHTLPQYQNLDIAQ